jgi:hypothetical protein
MPLAGMAGLVVAPGPTMTTTGAVSRRITSAVPQMLLRLPLSVLLLLLLPLLSSWSVSVSAMRPERIAKLRQDTVNMFYHGFDNYMDIAFPEDEVRPPPQTPNSSPVKYRPAH